LGAGLQLLLGCLVDMLEEGKVFTRADEEEGVDY